MSQHILCAHILLSYCFNTDELFVIELGAKVYIIDNAEQLFIGLRDYMAKISPDFAIKTAGWKVADQTKPYKFIHKQPTHYVAYSINESILLTGTI